MKHKGMYLIGMLLCVMIVLGLLPGTLQAGSADAWTDPGSGAAYTFEKVDQSSNDVRITHCDLPSGGDIAIPATITVNDIVYIVTEIGDEVFRNNTIITGVTIPAGLTSIGNQAFAGCTNLKSVMLESNSQLTTIGNSAFSGCSQLPGITIPKSVISIGNYAFYNCTAMTWIDFEPGIYLTSFGAGVFQNCTALTGVDIPEGVVSLSHAFTYCSSLARVRLPGSIHTVQDESFLGCSKLDEIFIPSDFNLDAFNTDNSIIVISEDNTFKVLVKKNSSEYWYGEFHACVAVPVISPGTGSYDSPQVMTLSCSTEGASIYYTLNGKDPGSNGIEYVSPVIIPSTTVIKAVAKKYGLANSTVAEAKYTIGSSLTSVSYIKADGTSGTLDCTVLPGGGATTLLEGNYVVNRDITYTGTVTLQGDVNIILCDGAKMTITSTDDYAIDGIRGNTNGGDFNISIFGQGNQSGSISAAGNLSGIGARYISLYGGTAEADVYGLRVNIRNSVITGSVSTFYNGSGIINLGWALATDRITATQYNGTVIIQDGRYMTAEGVLYSGALTAGEISAIAGKTLSPVNILVSGEIQHGTVTADKACASENETVTLTVAPAPGYVLGNLIVQQGETAVPVENNRFIMPAGSVTVTASFITEWMALKNALGMGGTVTLTKNITCMDQSEGPLLVPSGVNTILNLAGYTIDRGLSSAAAAVENGNVITVNGTLTLEDTSESRTGLITGGRNTGYGGGVTVSGTGALNMLGGTISSNAAGSGGGIYVQGAMSLSGAPAVRNNVPSNIYLTNNTTISVAGTLSNTDPIGVSAQTAPASGSNVVLTEGLSTNGAVSGFASDNASYIVGLVNGEAVLGIPRSVSIAAGISNGTVSQSHAAGTYVEGETVVLSVTPAEGYLFHALTYQPGNSDPAAVDAVPGADGVYTGSFVMPAADTTVTATFCKPLTHPDVSISDIPDLTYTGSALTPRIAVKDGDTPLSENSDYTVAVQQNGNNVSELINAGDYTVILTGTGDYAGSVTRSLKVHPAGVTLTASSDTVTYDGGEKTVSGFTCSVGGLVFTGVNAAGSGTDAGDYDVVFSGVTVNETKDSTGNYLVTGTVDGVLKINPADMSAEVTAESYSAPYDGAEHGITVTAPQGATVTYCETEDGTYTATCPVWRNRTNGTGETVYYRVEKPNYDTVAGSANVQIAYRVATFTGVTGVDKVYDGTKDADLNTGAVVMTNVLDGDEIYPVFHTAEFDSIVTGENKRIQFLYSHRGRDSDNYFVTYESNGDVTASISPRPITITAADQTITYGETIDYSADQVTLTFGSLAEGDIDSERFMDVLDSITLTPSTSNAMADGTITPGGAQIFHDTGYSESSFDVTDCYEITYVPGRLVINKGPAAALTDDGQKPAANTRLVYNGNPQPLVTGPQAALPEGYTVRYSLDGTAWSTEVPAVTDAGDYTVQVKYTNENYADITIDPIAVTVGQLTAGIAWSDEPLVYNGKEQAPAAAATGLAGDDRVSVTVSGARKDAGEGYTATASGLTGDKAKNYKLPAESTVSFSIEPKSITGAKVTLDKTRLAWTGSEQRVNVTGVTVDGLSLAADDYTVSGNTGTDTGSYTVTVSGKGNFTDSAAGTWEIADKAMTVSAGNVTVPYDGAEHGIKVTVTDPADGAVVKYGRAAGTYDLDTSPVITDVGEMTVYFKVTAANYLDYTGSAAVTVTKADPAVTAPKAKEGLVYTGSAQELVEAGSVTGGELRYALGADAAAAPADGWSGTVPTGTVAGTYYVWYKAAGDRNHNDSAAAVVTAVIAEAPKQPETPEQPEPEKLPAGEYVDPVSGAAYELTEEGTAVYKAPAEPASKASIPDTVPVQVNGQTVNVPVTAIAPKAFEKDKKLTTVTVGANVVTIGKNAFSGCAKLKTVKGGKSVKEIAANAFANCQKLQALPALPALESIGNKAFRGCIELTKVTLGAKVKKIGKEAFSGCKKLKTVTIKTKDLKKKAIGKNCFKGIDARAAFKCPKKQMKDYAAWLKNPGGAPANAVFK